MSLGDSSEILAAGWGPHPGFLLLSQCWCLPFSQGQAVVMRRAGRSLPVEETSDMWGCPGFSRHTGDAWWGRKEERGEGAALEVGKHKLSLEKCIEDWMVLGVRWEGSVGLSWKGLVVQSLES